MGIGRPTNGMKISDYVLSNFSKDEASIISEAISKSAEACEEWIEAPFLDVMNNFNGK
jgi:peptidyl-tRNA hydrolase, PTH1 family